jgi:hypothetical protein
MNYVVPSSISMYMRSSSSSDSKCRHTLLLHIHNSTSSFCAAGHSLLHAIVTTTKTTTGALAKRKFWLWLYKFDIAQQLLLHAGQASRQAHMSLGQSDWDSKSRVPRCLKSQPWHFFQGFPLFLLATQTPAWPKLPNGMLFWHNQTVLTSGSPEQIADYCSFLVMNNSTQRPTCLLPYLSDKMFSLDRQKLQFAQRNSLLATVMAIYILSWTVLLPLFGAI